MRKQDITYQDKLNELNLDIRHPNSRGKVFVILEGESDVKLYRKLFHEDNCKVERIPGAKIKVEECVQTLIPTYSLIIGIRDADFTHLNQNPYNKVNVFLTDFHDMEMMLVSTDKLFSSLLFDHTNLTKDQHSVIRNNLLSVIEPIGYLKWLNELEELGLNFEPGFNDLLSFASWSINFDSYISRVLGKSLNPKITDRTVILQKIEVLKSKTPDIYQLCNGHDFFKALLQYINLQHNATKVNSENIASACRMVYNETYYQTTELYQNTKQWADDNNCVIYQS